MGDEPSLQEAAIVDEQKLRVLKLHGELWARKGGVEMKLSDTLAPGRNEYAQFIEIMMNLAKQTLHSFVIPVDRKLFVDEKLREDHPKRKAADALLESPKGCDMKDINAAKLVRDFLKRFPDDPSVRKTFDLREGRLAQRLIVDGDLDVSADQEDSLVKILTSIDFIEARMAGERVRRACERLYKAYIDGLGQQG